MRLTSFAAVIVVQTILLVTLNGHAQNNALALNISLDKSEARIHQPNILRVVLTNKSDTEIVVPRSIGGGQAHLTYIIKITTSTGDRVSPLQSSSERVKHGFQPPRIFSREGYTVAPNETLVEYCELGSVFALNRPGIYHVQVEREFPAGSGTITRSNIVSFSLTP